MSIRLCLSQNNEMLSVYLLSVFCFLEHSNIVSLGYDSLSNLCLKDLYAIKGALAIWNIENTSLYFFNKSNNCPPSKDYSYNKLNFCLTLLVCSYVSQYPLVEMNFYSNENKKDMGAMMRLLLQCAMP